MQLRFVCSLHATAMLARSLTCLLTSLPARLSPLPAQVPVLFTGSIRDNLSPFGAHSDSALWSALRRSHLAPVVEAWQSEGLGGLDFQLGEGGAPLSAGQKQLLALARALLSHAKVRCSVWDEHAGTVCGLAQCLRPAPCILPVPVQPSRRARLPVHLPAPPAARAARSDSGA